MKDKKLKLIEALKKERTLFESRGQDTTEHDITIEYLETGKTDENPDDYELLDACMNDFDFLYDDYKDFK